MSLQNIPSNSPSFIDGVFFKDIKPLIKTKEDLENVLLSTKILFENKSELIEFFELLLEYGFKETALNYFEELINTIKDEELVNEFNLLLRK